MEAAGVNIGLLVIQSESDTLEFRLNLRVSIGEAELLQAAIDTNCPELRRV